MPQTSVATPGSGSQGRSAYDILGQRVGTFILKDANSIPFGTAVVYDAANGSINGTPCVKIPAGTGGFFMGISKNDDKHAADQAGGPQYLTNQNVQVAHEDVLWVPVEQNVLPSDTPYFRHTASGAANTGIGFFRKDSDGSTAAVLQQGTLTLSAALDGGTLRVQTITFGGALVTPNLINMTIDGTPIAEVKFLTNNDTTLFELVQAIKAAAQTAAAGPGGTTSISSIEIVEVTDTDGTLNRVIKIVSFASPTSCAITGATVAQNGGVSVPTITVATATAGVAAGALACAINDGTVNTTFNTSWMGASDETLQQFASELAGHPSVSSAVVTQAGGAFGLNRVITITAKAGATLTVTPTSPCGGVNNPTLVWAQTVAPVAPANKADLASNCRFAQAGTAGGLVPLVISVP